MKKILVLLFACITLGGCMATVSPNGTVHTAYLFPVREVVYHRPHHVHYVHAVPRPVPHHRPFHAGPHHGGHGHFR
ncbi:MAG: hypothetical protein MJ053_04195 [Elusimicrobiaceae bacterium]|nr:hypothetical protein [Elusimicrobiaceae bacterium]